MDVELMAANTSSSPPGSSPTQLRSSLSASIDSDSVGSSSLDTASASAHLERYENPWTTSELEMHRNRFSRRSRSYNAFLEWQAAAPTVKRASKHARPLAGASRKRLIRQIQQLTKDKAELQAQLAAVTTHTSGSDHTQSAGRGEGSSRQSSREPSYMAQARILEQMEGSDHLMDDTEITSGLERKHRNILFTTMSLEHIAELSDRLQAAIETSTVSLLKLQEAALLERPGLRSLLAGNSTFEPRRDSAYAQTFARRFLEVQKTPGRRSRALLPGPLQLSIKHPDYVDVLMEGLREPFIAHMGAFDDVELGLWILNGIQFHHEELGDQDIATAELDDDYFEIPAEMFSRFPFVGTKKLIACANRWRAMRGEPALEQTPEMMAAEEYTRSRQARVQESQGESSRSSR